MLLVKTVVKSSPIQGLGLFAAEDIPKGTVIWEFHAGIDLLLLPEYVKTLPDIIQQYVHRYAYTDMGSKEVRYILCSDDARFFNHDENPNVISDWNRDQYVAEVSARDIVAGEELTCDYRNFDANPFLGFGES